MKIDIFDVGHGACSVVTAPTGEKIMIDCGYRKEPLWWPSSQFFGTRFEALLITNMDEDHVADFGDMLKNCKVNTVVLNPTINAAALRAMKKDGMGKGVTDIHTYLNNGTRRNLPFDCGAIKVSWFYNPCGAAFTDTNNLSVAFFIEFGPFCMLYPGDLEVDGWKNMLGNSDFVTLLSRVDLFMTSHHGRENGCCDEIFDICKPWAFVISDKEMQHETQETNNWYRQHAKGMVKRGTAFTANPDIRYVFTTRNDKCLTIDVPPNGDFTLWTESSRQVTHSALFNLTASALAGR